MREIKFRGRTRTTRGTKWVYGHYYKVKSFFDDKEAHFISVIRSNHLTDFSVDEETVGQYTGLKDKNGVEIYEGNILPFTMIDGKQENYYIVFRDGEFDAINKQDANFIWRSAWKESVVIGNIYDNPELLKE